MGIRAGLGLIVCTLGLALAQPAQAQDALAEALALPVASGLTGARDAPRFAWVESAAGVRNLWVGSPARQVTAFTQDDGQQLYDLALSADGTSLAFVRGGDAEFPDDDLPNSASNPAPPRQQLFVIQTGGGSPTLIGEGHSPEFTRSGDRLAFTRDGEIWLWDRSGGARKLAAVEGEVRRLQWSPEGTRLLFVDHREDYSFVGLLDVGQQRLKYLDPGLGFSEEPVFSPDGRQVAYIRYFTPPADAPPESGPYWSVRVADAASGAGVRGASGVAGGD